MTSIANPKNPGHRTKANRLRKRAAEGGELTPEEAAWLSEYSAAQANPPSAPPDIGASATERIINIEERSAAVGTGAAAEVAAAAALAREEGRRLDYILKNGVGAMETAFKMQCTLMDTMMRRMEMLESAHMGMLEAVRTNYLARTQAEVDAIAAESDKSGQEDLQTQLMGALAAKLLTPESPAK